VRRERVRSRTTTTTTTLPCTEPGTHVRRRLRARSRDRPPTVPHRGRLPRSRVSGSSHSVRHAKRVACEVTRERDTRDHRARGDTSLALSVLGLLSHKTPSIHGSTPPTPRPHRVSDGAAIDGDGRPPRHRETPRGGTPGRVCVVCRYFFLGQTDDRQHTHAFQAGINRTNISQHTPQANCADVYKPFHPQKMQVTARAPGQGASERGSASRPRHIQLSTRPRIVLSQAPRVACSPAHIMST
jgi:hypothetical protein